MVKGHGTKGGCCGRKWIIDYSTNANVCIQTRTSKGHCPTSLYGNGNGTLADCFARALIDGPVRLAALSDDVDHRHYLFGLWLGSFYLLSELALQKRHGNVGSMESSPKFSGKWIVRSRSEPYANRGKFCLTGGSFFSSIRQHSNMEYFLFYPD